MRQHRLGCWLWAFAIAVSPTVAGAGATPSGAYTPISQDALEQWAARLDDGARPREYPEAKRGCVALPLGGIGTGSVAINGQGRLVQWQIFNNFNKGAVVPDSFFGLWVQGADGKALARRLETGSRDGLPGIEGLGFVGEYPVARLAYRDRALPVEVRLEAMNPLIPLNTRDSAIPGAIFTFHVTNPTDKPLRVSLLATQQNAVGYNGYAGIAGTRYAGYGGNVNQAMTADGRTLIAMTVQPGRAARLAKPVRLFTSCLGPREVLPQNATLAWPGQHWQLPEPARLAQDFDVLWIGPCDGPGFGHDTIRRLCQAVEAGAILLTTGHRHSLAYRCAVSPRPGQPVQSQAAADRPDILFEDFESGTYDRWTLEGEAFGPRPATGTWPAQQPVSGFRGQYLVNTYTAGDGPQGTATSKPFTIQRRYINFLVGGGGHAGLTCMNLLIDGKIVRTATGRHLELLEPACWDVAEFMGRQAILQIVDRHSGGWGHINIDHILFSDRPNAIPPEPILAQLADLLPVAFQGLAEPGPAVDVAPEPGQALAAAVPSGRVRVGPYLRFADLQVKPGSRVWLKAPDGSPLLVEGRYGKGRVLLYTADLPCPPVWTAEAAWPWALVAQAAGTTFEPATGIDPQSPYFGSLTLSTDGPAPTCTAQWQQLGALWEDFAADGRVDAPGGAGLSPAGQTWNAAVAVPFSLGPGEARRVRFVLTWHFPNHHYVHDMRVRLGNRYNTWYPDARAVADYIWQHLQRLEAETNAYLRAMYDTTLPYYVVDALTSQADIVRSQTCLWTEAGDFLGFEGNACCPMNCTHVWNYAQTLAKLWPELERRMREIDLGVQMREDGMVGHRCAVPPVRPESSEATDGQCGTVLKTYREYRQSADDAWLRQWYPRVKRATEFLIAKDRQAQPDARLDQWVPVDDPALLADVVRAVEPDGLILAGQPNTYDCVIVGPNPFVGSLYLAALRAAEAMAADMGDAPFAEQCRAIYQRGRQRFDKLLWKEAFGYYIQTYDEKAVLDQQFGWGCHADQLMGQWWADICDLGYILPRERVHAALGKIFGHNWRTNFRGHRQVPRVYALDDDKGLLICTWPHGRRPPVVTNYSDEIWTGIEYEVAAELIYQGFVREGLMVVLGCRDRYDGMCRPGTCGPVGNPFDEVECGTNYARAMSSWSVLLALQGYTYHGPKGILGFRPRYRPDHLRCFFSAAEGWGTFAQTREEHGQKNTVALAYGRLTLRELILETPPAVPPQAVVAQAAGRPVQASLKIDGSQVHLQFAQPLTLTGGQSLDVTLKW